jgi:hypothetical protein
MEIGIVLGALLLLAVARLIWNDRHAGKIPPLDESWPKDADTSYWFAGSNTKQEYVVQAAILTENRKTGRHLGPDVIVNWEPGKDWDIDNHGLWIEEYGPNNGVYVRRVGNKEPLAKPRRRLL